MNIFDKYSWWILLPLLSETHTTYAFQQQLGFANCFMIKVTSFESAVNLEWNGFNNLCLNKLASSCAGND